MKELLVYYILLCLCGVGMCYGKADDMNWKNYYRRDDIYLPVYRVLYVKKRYLIAEPVKDLYNPKTGVYRPTEWKKLGRFFWYRRKPLRQLRLRAYLVELVAQIVGVIALIFLLVGLILLYFVPESVEVVKTVWVLYGFVAAGSVFLYDLGMDIYLDHVRAKKIYNGEM